MSSWWRKVALSLGVELSRRSWRLQGMRAFGSTRQALADTGSGGWDRRAVTYLDKTKGVGPWSRYLVNDAQVTGWNDELKWNDSLVWDDNGTN